MPRFLFEGQEDDPEATEELVRDLDMTRYQRRVLNAAFLSLYELTLRLIVDPPKEADPEVSLNILQHMLEAFKPDLGPAISYWEASKKDANPG